MCTSVDVMCFTMMFLVNYSLVAESQWPFDCVEAIQLSTIFVECYYFIVSSC